MILKNSDYASLVKKIQEENRRIVVYGAGMIGKTIIPYLVKEYELFDRLDCFIDLDSRKKGQMVVIDGRRYRINTPEYLETIDKSTILLITNSKFMPVIQFLDGVANLDFVEGYIIPIMQIYELKQAKTIRIQRQTIEPLIPKKIHYCWFGRKEKPRFLQECIESWHKLCPGYEIICWNEDNYNVNKHRFTKEAYEKKRYGFVSDVARLDILYENGGIYFDTDVTLLKNLDELLYQPGFVGVEKWGNINTGGGCGFVAGHPVLKEMIEYRERFGFINEDGSCNVETNGVYETVPFLDGGMKTNNSLQVIKNVTVYPAYIFHPYDYMSCEMQKKETTISVHHFCGGWMEEEDKKNRKNTQEQYCKILKRLNESS